MNELSVPFELIVKNEGEACEWLRSPAIGNFITKALNLAKNKQQEVVLQVKIHVRNKPQKPCAPPLKKAKHNALSTDELKQKLGFEPLVFSFPSTSRKESTSSVSSPTPLKKPFIDLSFLQSGGNLLEFLNQFPESSTPKSRPTTRKRPAEILPVQLPLLPLPPSTTCPEISLPPIQACQPLPPVPLIKAVDRVVPVDREERVASVNEIAPIKATKSTKSTAAVPPMTRCNRKERMEPSLIYQELEQDSKNVSLFLLDWSIDPQFRRIAFLLNGCHCSLTDIRLDKSRHFCPEIQRQWQDGGKAYSDIKLYVCAFSEKRWKNFEKSLKLPVASFLQNLDYNSWHPFNKLYQPFSECESFTQDSELNRLKTLYGKGKSQWFFAQFFHFSNPDGRKDAPTRLSDLLLKDRVLSLDDKVSSLDY